MTQQERKELREQIVAYRKEGHLIRECCERFGVTKGYVKYVCLGIDYPWVRDTEAMRQAALEQGKHRLPDEQTAINMIADRLPQFEYFGNYTDADGTVDLKCKECGTVITRQMCAVRHKQVRCPECFRRASELRKETRLRIKEADKNIPILTHKKAKQIQFKVCPVCNGMFFGSRRYCSDECNHKNKWAMRDGYRHLFPLKEVYERDNGVCYLCGGLCDWNDYEEKDGVIVYGNNYPSRDHVIPKACGGENSWENIRLAHRVCNSRKSTAPYAKI